MTTVDISLVVAVVLLGIVVGIQEDRLRDHKAKLAEVSNRVYLQERARAKKAHEHEWMYGSAITGDEGSWGGRMRTYWWECQNSDVCGKGRASTNMVANVPDHFPEELR